MKDFSKWRQRFKKHSDNIFFIVVLLLLVALAVAVMGWVSIENCLQQLLGLEQNEKYKVLKTIGFCIVGVLLVWQAWAANKRANAIDATAREQANATKNTEAGQRQERLKNAIEHLGHKRDSVRMGGAYELFHLAKDTKKLRQTVLKILCAHIRQMTGKNKYREKHKAEPSEEIQGLLTLLFIDKHNVFKGCPINLQGSYLNGATLGQARLKKANLVDVQLQGAELWGAQLQGAVLMAVKLQRATLWGTQLQGANLCGAQLREASLSNAQLQGADLSVTQMQRANLRAAQLQGANLWRAQLQGANLSKAQLQGANLSKAQLQRVDLKEAQLQGVSSQVHPLPLAGFESNIRNRIGKLSDLTGIIFAGGLQQEYLDALCEGLSAEEAQVLREKLRSDVKPEISHELPRDSGADTRTSYTQKEAEQWIAEYNKAIREVPKRDNG